MDHPNKRATPPRSSPSHQFRHTRAVLIDLFNLYLGVSRTLRPKIEDADEIRESPKNLQKRVTAPNVNIIPRNEQFLLDFEKIREQFQDQDQLRMNLDPVLVSFVIQCADHAPRAEFMLYALRVLCSINYVNWDTFLLLLLSTVFTLETSGGQEGTSQSMLPNLQSTNLVISDGMITLPSSGISNSTNFNGSNIAFTPHLSSNNSIVFSTHPTIEHPDGVRLLPIKENHIRHISCKIILIGLEFNLKPFTHAEIFSHMLTWLSNWDKNQILDEIQNRKEWKPRGPLNQKLHLCLDVVWMLVDEERCRVPFYEFLRSGLQFLGNSLDDVSLFPLILKIHRRRDMVALYMQMLDQNLHCPSFGTHRILSHTHASISGEAMTNLRHSPITYPSVLGEPLYGEDIAASIPKGSMDWERAMRCLRHALRTAPSPDWWRRVLIVAPCYRQHPQQVSYPGAVFSSAMVCEAVIDRTIELLNLVYSDIDCWNEWLSFSDIFYFLIKSACIDFIDFINKLSSRVMKDGRQIPRTNHVTWMLAQIIRLEIAVSSLSVDVRNRSATDSRNVETARKMISFHKEDKNSDKNNDTAQSTLLDFVSSSQALRFWSFNHLVRDYLSSDQLQKGKKIDDWWKQVTKEKTLDFMNLDDQSLGMLWVLSFTMAQPVMDAVVNWLKSAGVSELAVTQNVQSNERIMIMNETCPLPMKLLSGLSINLCWKLYLNLEEIIFFGQVIPSIAMVETYVRLLLVAPYSIFRPHFTSLTSKVPNLLTKTWVLLLLLEILNYRLFSLYRYYGKSTALLCDVTKIISMIKGKCGEHRTFRLAENLCINLILSIRDFFVVKKDLKGSSDFTETLNRITIVSLAITIKTRGIADVDHMLRLQPVLEQIMSTCQHTWSDKTMRHFPQLIRDFLIGRMDRRAHTIQTWEQAEPTVLKQCTQLLSPSGGDPKYVRIYVDHSFPEHRLYLCSGAWILMGGHPENINSANLACVLKELSPEEVTKNIYTMVDVLLHHIQIELQHGHTLQDLLLKVNTNLASLVLQHELLPLDILLLALIDRDDDPYALRIVLNMLERQELQQKIKIFCSIRGSPDHWLNSGVSQRIEVQKALGNHLSSKDRYPTFFDDSPTRLLPVIPLIVYRLIENDATDAAVRVLAAYSSFLIHHPLRFSFVRDILAYFYGHLPNNLILRLLNVLDISKIPFSESFPQHVSSSNPVLCPPPEYFINLLLGLVNNVIPSITSKSKPGTTGGTSSGFSREPPVKTQSSSQFGSPSSDGRRPFYQNQDPGTYTQFVLETAVIEILSLPVTTAQIVSSLVQIMEHIQSTLIRFNNGLLGFSGSGQSNGLPTSPSGASAESLGTPRSNNSSQGINASGLMSKTVYSWQQLSSLMIQACGLLFAQLPVEFHLQLYSETSRVIKECWWLADGKRSAGELDTSVGYALLDPSCASQENTSTAIGNTVALLHSFFSNLPQEWLESTQTLIKNFRPVTSVAILRIIFRIIGPLMPRLGFVRPVFLKIVHLLFNCMSDIFGKQTSSSVEASEITDIIDFLHHIVHYEGQGGGPVQSNSKPKSETLKLCGKAIEMLRPDIRHLLSHLSTDPISSIYAATHPNLNQNLT